jgi:hypothetical protein
MAVRWWCTPVILATQEAEIRQIVRETLSQENLSKKKKAGGVALGIVPENPVPQKKRWI